jgi:hypothetical protein
MLKFLVSEGDCVDGDDGEEGEPLVQRLLGVNVIKLFPFVADDKAK